MQVVLARTRTQAAMVMDGSCQLPQLSRLLLRLLSLLLLLRRPPCPLTLLLLLLLLSPPPRLPPRPLSPPLPAALPRPLLLPLSVRPSPLPPLCEVLDPWLRIVLLSYHKKPR